MTDEDKRELRTGYITLRDHFERIFEERDKQMVALMSNLDQRLEKLNELRADVTKDREQFVKQETYNIKTTFYDEWCRGVDKEITAMRTRSVTWTAALGVFFILIELAIYFFRR